MSHSIYLFILISYITQTLNPIRLIYEEGEEALDPNRDYDICMTLCTSPTIEVRPTSALKCGFVNHSNINS